MTVCRTNLPRLRRQRHLPPLRPGEPVPERTFPSENVHGDLRRNLPPELPAPAEKADSGGVEHSAIICWLRRHCALMAICTILQPRRPRTRPGSWWCAGITRNDGAAGCPEPETGPEETEPTARPTRLDPKIPTGVWISIITNTTTSACLPNQLFRRGHLKNRDIDWKRSVPVPAMILPSHSPVSLTAAAGWWRTGTRRKISRARRKQGFPSRVLLPGAEHGRDRSGDRIHTEHSGTTGWTPIIWTGDSTSDARTANMDAQALWGTSAVLLRKMGQLSPWSTSTGTVGRPVLFKPSWRIFLLAGSCIRTR